MNDLLTLPVYVYVNSKGLLRLCMKDDEGAMELKLEFNESGNIWINGERVFIMAPPEEYEGPSESEAYEEP